MMFHSTTTLESISNQMEQTFLSFEMKEYERNNNNNKNASAKRGDNHKSKSKNGKRILHRMVRYILLLALSSPLGMGIRITL